MNEELRTIFINLNNAEMNSNWDAVARAAGRLAVYLMDPPKTVEDVVWEEKYLDADESRASWRVLALSRDKTIAELKKTAAEDEQRYALADQHRDRIRNLEQQLEDERAHGTRLYDENTELDQRLESARARIAQLAESVQHHHDLLTQREQQLEAERVRIAELDTLLYSASYKARLWCSRATEYGWREDDESSDAG